MILSNYYSYRDDNKQLLNTLKFIELKTRRSNMNFKQARNYKRFQTRKWWCQSFLVGIKDIYVGLRNENGLINRIEHVNVSSLPKECEVHCNNFNCLNCS